LLIGLVVLVVTAVGIALWLSAESSDVEAPPPATGKPGPSATPKPTPSGTGTPTAVTPQVPTPGTEPGPDEPGVDVAPPDPTPTPTPTPGNDRVRPTKKRPAAPTAEALMKRISRLEGVAKKKNLGPNAASLLETYRLQATAAESVADREALARKLDGWEDAFLGK
jgi:hypothetical protein